MTGKYQSPIFCDHCSLLALAELDGAPLCAECLLDEIKKTDDPKLLLKIHPLLVRAPRFEKSACDFNGSTQVA